MKVQIALKSLEGSFSQDHMLLEVCRHAEKLGDADSAHQRQLFWKQPCLLFPLGVKDPATCCE